jgi:hypothetical protein
MTCIPGLIKMSSAIEKLAGGIHRHTHTAWRSHKPAFMMVSCSAYSTLKLKATCSSENYVYFNGLHAAISQKSVLFLITAGRNSDAAYCL